jgi:heat shock protein HspQ
MSKKPRHIGGVKQWNRSGGQHPVFCRRRGRETGDEQVARSRPPKDKPWYHVLVNEAAHTTYVAEQNLEPAEAPQRIVHPFADSLFSEFDGERYKLRQQAH